MCVCVLISLLSAYICVCQDLREDEETLEMLEAKEMKPISFEDGRALAEIIGAHR